MSTPPRWPAGRFQPDFLLTTPASAAYSSETCTFVPEAKKTLSTNLTVEETGGRFRCARASRREFLIGLAGLGAASLLPAPASRLWAQGAAGGRIDVHHHISSPGFIAAIKARKTGQIPLEQWTVEKDLEAMDQGGVAAAIGSISEPGVWFGDDAAARALARECNEYQARLVADHPGRFGMFATLPMPDVDGTLKEIEYAFDTLKADGVCFMSSYQSKYLGDVKFAPVMDELNRRKAVVYTHPFRGECCINLLPNNGALGLALVNDTSWTIASILQSGTTVRCPDIRFIWSHGGGTAPYVTSRLGARNLPEGGIPELQKFYYDTAQAYSPYTLPSFLKLVPTSHILFGTDYPFQKPEVVTKGLTDYGISAGDLRAIDRENALALFPRLKRS